MTEPTARWTLDDGAGDVYTFVVNPNAMSSPWLDVPVTASGTTAPGGAILLTEGARTAKEMTISGVLLDQMQHDILAAWLNKRRRVYLTDHFSRRMIVFIKAYNPVPKRRTSWKHDWEMTLLVLAQPRGNVATTSTVEPIEAGATAFTTETETTDTTTTADFTWEFDENWSTSA